MVAMVRREAGFLDLVDTLVASRGGTISAANALEAAIVVDSYQDPVVSRDLDRIRRVLDIPIAPVTATHVDLARQAYRDYGKGSGHPAQLNFGDCFAYALAAETGEPLLFVGDDFRHTDIEPALAS